MQVGRMLTSGCDVWLNNPIRPNEASGTSGMKPPVHGGLNASILDGWWPEGFDGTNGWAVGDESEFKSRAKQDSYDAKALVDVLEQEIVPLFYDRDAKGLPNRWRAAPWSRSPAASTRTVWSASTWTRTWADGGRERGARSAASGESTAEVDPQRRGEVRGVLVAVPVLEVQALGRTAPIVGRSARSGA